MHTLLTWSHGVLKVSSFREPKMSLFAMYSNFKFVNRQIIDPSTEKNSIQVTLLLKFILMCQFYALFMLIFLP